MGIERTNDVMFKPAVASSASRVVARNGLPLPALTAVQAGSQLVWRVLGPFRPDVDPVLRWLSGAELNGDGGIGEWRGHQLKYRVARVRAEGMTIPLADAVLRELLDGGTRDSTAYRRLRRVFGLPEPRKTRPQSVWTRWLGENTRTALRVLTAVGPTDIYTLVEAVRRTHKYRKTPVPTGPDLETGLRHVGASVDEQTGRWSAPPGATPAQKDAALVAAAAAAISPLTIGELLTLLHRAGYRSSTISTPVIGTHPLVQRVDKNAYRVLVAPDDACQWPVESPRWWPLESPHPVADVQVFVGASR